MKRGIEFVICALIIFITISVSYNLISANKCRSLESKNAELQQQIQDLQQDKAGFKEGKYTLITNLSSSIYLNRIPNNFDKIYPWEDVNGVKGFDTVSGGLYLRYVEGHIQWPQLALYAPNMHMEVVSDKKWPKEGP